MRFPECQSHTRSLVPERFRGGCSFGGPAETESLSRAGPCRSNRHRRRKLWRSAKAESIRRLGGCLSRNDRSEEHTSELQSLMRISYAVFCLKKKNKNKTEEAHIHPQH